MDAESTPSGTTEIEALRREISGLRKEVQRLNDHRFVQVQNSTRRMLTLQLMRGLALGLGTVIGASVLVSLLAFFLSQIDFIPIIGEWAKDFAQQIEAEMALRQIVEGAEGGRRAGPKPALILHRRSRLVFRRHHFFGATERGLG